MRLNDNNYHKTKCLSEVKTRDLAAFPALTTLEVTDSLRFEHKWSIRIIVLKVRNPLLLRAEFQ